MLFNSFTFFVFFGAVLLLHHLPFPWKLKKFNLLLASYIFYAAWSPPLVALIWLSTLVDWFAASGIHRATTHGGKRAFLLLSLASNLGLLGYFKYGAFLLENFVALCQGIGIDYHPATPNIVLPIGISFYTFQTLSYTLDVYRGKMKPWGSFQDFALFVTFFPQLVAGPIVRAEQFLPQCLEPHRASARRISWGLFLLVVGLLQKSLIADMVMAPISDRVFNFDGPVQWSDAWVGSMAFSIQIFFDFAGYSTCAIGVALCLGFALPDNFRNPYGAIGFSDFWRRWHISLSVWLRDYLYISLGGNRVGTIRVHANLLATMVLGGLWHGASWTFVAWGGLHGIYLVAERLLAERGFMAWVQRGLGRKVLAALLTYAAVCLTWVLFRAQSFGHAWDLIRPMLGLSRTGAVHILAPHEVLIATGVGALILVYHWFMRDTSLEAVAQKTPGWCQSLVLGALLFLLLWTLRGGVGRAFIYFQF